MTPDQIQGIIRNILMFVGALVTLVGFGWSFVHLGSLSKPAA